MAGAGVDIIDVRYPFDEEDSSIILTCDYQCHLKNSVQAIYPGDDWASTKGTKFPLYAIEDGLVTDGFDPAGAKISILYASNREWLYVHLSSQVKFGIVKKGDLIGYAGATGNATGVHLHLGLAIGGYNKWVDPDKFISEHINKLPFTQQEMDEIIKEVKWSTIQSNLKTFEHLDIVGDTWIETRLIRSDNLSEKPYENVWYVTQTRYSYDQGKSWSEISGGGALSCDLQSKVIDGVLYQFALDTKTNSIMRYTKGSKNVLTNWKAF